MHLMYNMVCAQKLGHRDGNYPLCPSTPESNDHIFFGCFKAQRGWVATTIFYKPHSKDNSLVESQSFIDILDGALQKTLVGTARLYVIYHTYWELWNQRNDRVYNHKHPIFSARATTELTKEHIAAATKYSLSYKKRQRLKKATKYILPFRVISALNQEPPTSN